jgi:tetratricopeptide (TPR) repeat protein
MSNLWGRLARRLLRGQQRADIPGAAPASDQPPEVLPPAPAPAPAPTPAPTPGPQVFVSHSSADNAFGLRLADALRVALGGDEDAVFYDSDGGLKGGDQWLHTLQHEIVARNVFALILSPQAFASPWVDQELNLAFRRAVTDSHTALIPVLHQRTEIWPFLENFQRVSFLAQSFERAFADLLAAVRLGASRRAAHEEILGVRPGQPFDLDLLPLPERFVGREADVEWVLERLAPETTAVTQAPGVRAVVGLASITAVNGLAGIGKSVLAAQLVRILAAANRFPDGIAVVRCNDLTDPVVVLRRVLARFDPRGREPDAGALQALRDQARRVFAGHKALVVLDNIEPNWPIEEVIAALRVAGAVVLTTSRQRLPTAAVPANESRELEVLSPDEALDLFAEYYGRGTSKDLTVAEQGLARRITQALGYHTLAVKLAAARARQRDLAKVAAEYEADLREGIRLRDGREAVLAALESSVAALPPSARTLFAALAAFATTDVGREAVLALAHALDDPDPTGSLNAVLDLRLADIRVLAALPENADRERVRLHPLLRAFAEALFAHWSEPERDVASLAVARHLAAYAEANQSRHGVLAADVGNLTGALEWAHAQDQAALVVDLAHGLRLFWRDRGPYREGGRFLAWGVAAAEATQLLRERPAVGRQGAELCLVYGQMLVYSGQPEAGAMTLQRSLESFREAEDRPGEGAALSALGEAAMWRSQFEAAPSYLEQALAIAREIGDRQGEGADLGYLGQMAAIRGQLQAAAGYLEQALAIRREVGDRRGECEDLTGLAQVAHWRGHYEAAASYLEQALAIAREIGDRQNEGVDLGNLGFVALRRGQYEAAAGYLEQAMAITREIGAHQDEGAGLSLLGQLALRRGELEAAADYLEQALAIHREVGDRRWETESVAALGHVAEAQGDLARAETLYRQSLALATELGLGPETAEAQLALGRLLAERLNRRDEGCPLILDAARRFAEMGMPEEQEAREAAQRQGCSA